MKKNHIIVSIVEALAGIALILVGSHGRRIIGDQLRKQKITFAPYTPLTANPATTTTPTQNSGAMRAAR